MIRFKSKVFSLHGAIVAALLTVFVFFFSVIPQHGFVYPHLVNSGHAFVFGLGAYLLMLIFARPDQFGRVLMCAFLAFSLGVLVEIIQPFFGRQRSLIDAYYDLIGSIAAVLWFTSFSQAVSHSSRNLYRGIALLLLVSSLAYPGFRLYIKQEVDSQKPVIADFERFWWSKIMWANNKADLVRVEAPDAWPNDSLAGRILFRKGALYPGISFAYLTSDWRGFDYLEFDLYSEHPQELSVNLRIHDRSHNNRHNDRYNRRLTVGRGLNSFRISLEEVQRSPKARELDLKRVAGLMFFMSRPEKDIEIYLDNMRLSSRKE